MEKHLLTYHIEHAPWSVQLPRQGLVLRMLVTNLRNRPLPKQHLSSLATCILGLYKSLITGSKDFPLLVCQGALHSSLLTSPCMEGTLVENVPPAPVYPLSRAPPGLMVPPASPSSPVRAILMPHHPEKTQYRELKVDRRNCVRVLSCNGKVIIRVVSPVYWTDYTERPNRWRISDYDAEGDVVMSVLCQFKQSAEENASNSAKRKKAEDESSSPSPSTKRLRV